MSQPNLRPLPQPASIPLSERAQGDIGLPLQVAREAAREEGIDWDGLPPHVRMERVQATQSIISAYQAIVTAVPTGAVNSFPKGTRHASFVEGMIWQLNAIPFPSEVRRVHAEALRRYGPVSHERVLETAP